MTKFKVKPIYKNLIIRLKDEQEKKIDKMRQKGINISQFVRNKIDEVQI